MRLLLELVEEEEATEVAEVAAARTNQLLDIPLPQLIRFQSPLEVVEPVESGVELHPLPVVQVRFQRTDLFSPSRTAEAAEPLGLTKLLAQVELQQLDLQVVPEELHQLRQVFTAALERTVLRTISSAQ
jgi:hypothetical protein